jgi:hypothetical protein
MESTSDIQVFKESLVAAARGPFFPDREFHTLFGLYRAEVEAIANAFSSTISLTGDVALALSNSMNNLIGYPHGQEAAWSQWLSVTPAELQVILSRWQASCTQA